MNVCELFERARLEAGNRPALVGGFGAARASVTYHELGRRVDRAAAKLRRLELRPGDRVLLAVPLSIETYVTMLAVLKAGLVVVVVDPAQGRRDVAHCLAQHAPTAVVGTRTALALGRLLPQVRRIPRRILAAELCADGAPESTENGGVPVARRADADPAVLSFTSGSTGRPKAVVRSHGFLRRQLRALGRVADASGEDIELVTMPMFVLFNLAHALTSVLPACSVRHPGRANAAMIGRQLAAERVTRVIAPPALLERLADQCLQAGSVLPGLRCIATGGGPVSPTLPGRLRAMAPNAVVRCVYGSTEAEPISVVDDHEVSIEDRRRMAEGAGLLAGRPVPGCHVRLLPADAAASRLRRASFEALCLPPGQIGEIVVSGDHVLRGYADPACDVETKIDVEGIRWHRTGDAGYLDDDGRLWLVGRCRAAITDSRGTIYPFQLEYAVIGTPGVRRAALIELDGQRVLAVECTASRALLVESLPRAVRRQLDRIVTVRRLPTDRRHDSKIDYPRLESKLHTPYVRLRDRAPAGSTPRSGSPCVPSSRTARAGSSGSSRRASC